MVSPSLLRSNAGMLILVRGPTAFARQLHQIEHIVERLVRFLHLHWHVRVS